MSDFKKEIKDKLGEVLILLEKEDFEKLPSDDKYYLDNLYNYLSKVLKHEYEAQEYEDKYYDSNCYPHS